MVKRCGHGNGTYRLRGTFQSLHQSQRCQLSDSPMKFKDGEHRGPVEQFHRRWWIVLSLPHLMSAYLNCSSWHVQVALFFRESWVKAFPPLQLYNNINAKFHLFSLFLGFYCHVLYCFQSLTVNLVYFHLHYVCLSVTVLQQMGRMDVQRWTWKHTNIQLSILMNVQFLIRNYQHLMILVSPAPYQAYDTQQNINAYSKIPNLSNIIFD